MIGGLVQISGIVADLVFRVEAVPRPGQEAIVHDFTIQAGGGFNAMAAAARSGLAVTYAGGLGAGPFADVARRALAAEGITVNCRTDPGRDQGVSTVLVDADGERSFIAAEGAEGHRGPDDYMGLPQAGFTLLSGYVLHYRGARAATRAWLDAAPRPGLVFDPSPVVAALDPGDLAAALKRAAWVSANRDEARVITGHADPEDAARTLAADRAGAIVRMGAEGCWIAKGDQLRHFRAYGKNVVDTTGAGDTHVGAFLAELAHTGDAFGAARFATVAAGLSIARHGPATAPRRAETEAVLARTDLD